MSTETQREHAAGERDASLDFELLELEQLESRLAFTTDWG
jgi:hypothetical protein